MSIIILVLLSVGIVALGLGLAAFAEFIFLFSLHTMARKKHRPRFQIPGSGMRHKFSGIEYFLSGGKWFPLEKRE